MTEAVALIRSCATRKRRHCDKQQSTTQFSNPGVGVGEHLGHRAKAAERLALARIPQECLPAIQRCSRQLVSGLKRVGSARPTRAWRQRGAEFRVATMVVRYAKASLPVHLA